MARAELDELIIFIHIPKTAGSTLLRIMEREYGDAMFHVGPSEPVTIDRLLSLPPDRLARLRAVAGHLPFGLHELLDRPATYVTLLRDPVERIVSHFAYSARTPASPLHAQVEAAGHDLARYVSEAPAAAYFNNGQTRLLGATDPRTSAPATQDTLVRAKENLSRYFSVIGTTERFDESLRLMADAFGWSMPPYRREKVSQNRPERVTKEQVRAIIERNELDAELYTFAAERLSSAVSSRGGGAGRAQ
jgi:hypothetical protein